MIIECPQCATRYDIKAALPPEGRMVRCAKCGHKWRAGPAAGNGVLDEARPTATATARGDNGQATQAPGQTGNREQHERPDPAAPVARAANGLSEDAAFQQSDEALKAGFLASDDFLGEASVKEFERETSSSLFEKNEEKIRWLGGGQENNIAQYKPEPDNSEESPSFRPAVGAAPFSQHSRHQAHLAEAQDVELQTLEEARAAVRNVFSALSDGRAAGYPFGAAPSYLSSGQEQGGGFASGQTAHGFAARPDAEDFSGNFSGPQPDAGVRGSADNENAFAVDPAAWGRFEGEGEIATGQASGGAGFAYAQEESIVQDLGGWDAETRARLRETLDRNEALWKRPTFEQDRIAESVLEEEAVNAELSSENDGGFDNRLYAELQQSQQHTHNFERRKRTGSLALAAGWGLFLCAASGLIVGFLNFRDILADALPGLAPVYRALGLPITVQSLVFEGVQYEWKMSGGRPALLVKGAVYNRAQRKVKVPAFFITIKDQNAEFDKEFPASLNVNGSKIRAGQKAEFEIELLSPRPTIRSVELELRNVH